LPSEHESSLAAIGAEFADTRTRLAATERALRAAEQEARDLRRERDRVLELLAKQESWLAAREPEPERTRARHRTGSLLPKVRAVVARAWQQFRPPPLPAPAVPPPAKPPPARREAPLVPHARDGAPARPVLFAAVWGLVPAELERVVARIQTSAAQAGVHPVFLTDCARLEILRAHRALFEYLPPMEELARLAPADDALLYLVRRLDLLRRKWQPVRIVACGEEATAILARLAAREEASDALRDLVGSAEGEPLR
jgi:hypothetical protein